MNLFNNFSAETIIATSSALLSTYDALNNITYIMNSSTGPPGLTHPLLMENSAWIDLELERRDTAIFKPLCPIPLRWLRNKQNILLTCLERDPSDTPIISPPYPEMRLIRVSRLSDTGEYYYDYEYYYEYHYDLDNYYSESDPNIHVMEEDEGFIMHVVSDDEGEEEGDDEGDEYVREGVHVVSDDEGEEEEVGEGLPFEQVLW